MKREIRSCTELRADGQSGGDEMAITGYAALFNVESKDLGGFRETISPGAFTRSLKANADVKATLNHDPNFVLGRTKSGTLTLSQDDRGLKFRAVLDSASQLHRDVYATIKRGDMDECSFAFVAAKGGQEFALRGEGKDAYVCRTLTDVDLMDVSAVTYPAYGGTSVAARSLFPDGDVPEIRSAIRSLKPVETRDEDSYEDMISEICAALCEKYPAAEDTGAYWGGQYWVVETYADSVIACDCKTGDYFRISYHEDEVNETFLFGEPQAVEKEWVASERSKTFVAEKRSHLENLAAQHKAAADDHSDKAKAEKEAADAIAQKAEEKKSYRLANGLMDEEDYDDNCYTDLNEMDVEDRAAFAAAETRAANGKVLTKKIGGAHLTKDKFAFVGDASDTTTWKLPIHDADHVRNALARFNQTQGIPEEKKAGVLRKIKAAAAKFGVQVSDEDNTRALAFTPMDGDDILNIRARLALALIP